MARIRITRCSHEDLIPLQLGDERKVLDLKQDSHELSEAFLKLLDDSHIEYERLPDESADETVVAAAEEAGEVSGDSAPASDPPPAPPSPPSPPAPPAPKKKAAAKPKAAKAPAKKGAAKKS
ncbi:MAG TPA: hypothetical protein VF470_04385 [Sphingomicrobium sp.]